MLIHCHRCQANNVYRYGKTPAGHARHSCPASLHVFQITYIYQGRNPDIKG
ncbi:IS1 family transposase [Buttiauxella sp. A111]|uniref:IS1 family transposase n=1 Tax=Buttiauxella sp. A111 TaxID=2563088 RepID=UPI00160B16D7